jgi:hypothetical protein
VIARLASAWAWLRANTWAVFVALGVALAVGLSFFLDMLGGRNGEAEAERAKGESDVLGERARGRVREAETLGTQRTELRKREAEIATETTTETAEIERSDMSEIAERFNRGSR